MRLSRVNLGSGLLWLWVQISWAQPAAEPDLIGRLGCAHCHEDLPPAPALAIPDLSDAGLRYQPAYLHDFLQNPTRVRRHLGAARMPDFHLTPSEAGALVAFLATQRGSARPPLPTPLTAALEGPARSISSVEARAAGVQLCLGCHPLNGAGAQLAADLSHVGYRLQPGWVRQFLARPDHFGVAPALMPGLYPFTDSASPQATAAAERIRALSDHLFDLGAARRAELEAAFAKSTPSDVVRGRELFLGLNCLGCHPHSSLQDARRTRAPKLTTLTRASQPAWLRQFLTRPHAIRPAGYHPGDGSRMPNFGLTETEVAQVLEELAELSSPFEPGGYIPRPLSRFARDKAATLLTERFSCLGCHSLGGAGGRLGPELADVGSRRTPEYIRDMVLHPGKHQPESIMPRTRLPKATERLIVEYLVSQTNSSPPSRYLSPLEHRLFLSSSESNDAAGQYLRYCAACHGTEGRGDGFNAAFLPVRPTAHADGTYLGRRPDDTLFDGIHGGGAILNRSHRMPPWGETLTAAEISALVKHLRVLCGCEPPAWSVK